MTKPVKRPRGPQGHAPQYRNLSWPNDVTLEQVNRWREQWLDDDIPVTPEEEEEWRRLEDG